MEYFGWKLKKDGKTIEVYKTDRAMRIEVNANENVIPMWITAHPTPEDFRRWRDRIPGARVYDYLLDDRFDRMDDRVIVAILEKEGTIEHGSYSRTQVYGKDWTVRVCMDEQERNMAKKRQNAACCWSLSESEPSCWGDWKRSFVPTPANKER